MTEPTGGFSPADEDAHPFDPSDPSWNESWFFSWVDLDGGPAGFFRVGLLPNQGRAMLWSFVHDGDGWLGREESRLTFRDFDSRSGVAYDRWGLSFAWKPAEPLGSGRFEFAGNLLQRTGLHAGAHVPVSLDLQWHASGVPVGTATSADDEHTPHPASRFEQSLQVSGTVVVGGLARGVRAGGHRDHSWGPRERRIPFAIGDLQDGERQLYFVGAPSYGIGNAYLRDGDAPLRHLSWVDPRIDYDDVERTFHGATLHFADANGQTVDVEVAPITPSVAFDMAHTCEPPEQWTYWRTLVEGAVSGWDAGCRGWLESNRFGHGEADRGSAARGEIGA